MSKLLKYKGFSGSVTCSIEDEVIYGKIECINDLVTYEAESMSELKAAFEEAVDDYIETCEMLGKSPDKPMSGTFNIRIGSELHKKAHLASKDVNVSLNDFIKIAIEEKVSQKREVHMHLHVQDSQSESIDNIFSADLALQSAKRFTWKPSSNETTGQTSGIH
ncbi:TPA: type II toxin-antitoxin system HicB family antitoxin [Vibrio parahaemolyticus]|uniref:type II toxin-antitoxin system HicB family antitoxin n=1 Tax=Vibrio parahaemolyticus TaxID=670 RepID=UPI001122E66F|nr:type II toxin-antitoxin system HicB family antitoxin [Vibrio parahaemolyticus]MBE3759993.1 type II toxin-antitoxin system HicB family antitoxin [Vibrio parahaemolyticus]TOI26462.1 toxin-antitoxin system HicB family antitoxin [Vibrio parahaemolyticus]HCG6617011.1 type II toxin-antitoxin system HicB family antitoxin [Vibrio parahaemolyticus]